MDIPALYARLIQAIGDGTGMADSLLHVHAGMAVLLITRIVTGYRLSTPVPLAVVALAELGNEVLDRIFWGSWRWEDTSLDILNTMFWPTMLFIGLRLRDRFEPRATPGNAA
ncbi:hypothetical protein ASE70_10090 [Sphingomonas sp. Leaf22]|uniref:hypothetical protein n=1 Tax=Sphingomonas sp. Leaf22 TaxID=1735687 RepID=UPI0006F3B45A|nr:hypothetical protein [Sphingomonas sp. Leaf22]KQM76141.1 hypothetical protein ASE70_10090 [Sphingomonas sp. Leaf22]